MLFPSVLPQTTEADGTLRKGMALVFVCWETDLLLSIPVRVALSSTAHKPGYAPALLPTSINF